MALRKRKDSLPKREREISRLCFLKKLLHCWSFYQWRFVVQMGVEVPRRGTLYLPAGGRGSSFSQWWSVVCNWRASVRAGERSREGPTMGIGQLGFTAISSSFEHQNRNVDPQLCHSTEPCSSNPVTAYLEYKVKGLCKGGAAVWGALWTHSSVKHTKLEKTVKNNHLRSLETILRACSKWGNIDSRKPNKLGKNTENVAFEPWHFLPFPFLSSAWWKLHPR